jgi:recombinational DNA repair ATPase RecF
MTARSLTEFPAYRLVQRFIEIGIEQDKAQIADEISKYNRLFREKTSILSELKSRKGDQRRVLIPLYEHPNMQVRLNAARATLAIEPQAARKVLEAIRASRMPHHALDAGMTLSNLESGFFKPE